MVEGDWLIALTQDAGRGRQGRHWVSEPGNFFGSTLVELRSTEPRQLRGQGVEIVAGPRDEPSWGLRGAYIRDSDGNLLELMRQLLPGEWSQWLREADDRYV